MTVTIRFSRETVKELMARLRLALRQLNRPLIQQISALLLLDDGLEVWSIAGRVGVSTTAIYSWRDGFLVDRWASLLRGKSSGRPPKLTPSQLKRLKELDEERLRSITFDNGTEFARCHRLEKHLGLALYYADPGCPYQRGTNENTNGLIRQYFPKGTDFRDISHDEVRRAESLLNNRPRACLGFRTPAEVFFEKTPPAGCD